MDETTRNCIDIVRCYMKNTTSDERIEIILELLDGYCEHCGDEEPCYCRYDD